MKNNSKMLVLILIAAGLFSSCKKWHPGPGENCNDSLLVQFGVNQCHLVTDHEIKVEPTVPKPGYLQSFIDPVFGSKVTRITGDVGTAIPVGGTWGDISRPGYEQRPVWNADQSMMVLENVNGANRTLFLDGSTYQPLFEKNPPGEFRWHPQQPNMMTYVRNGELANTCELGLWNVMTEATTIQKVISGYKDGSLEGVGNWSSDASMVALRATRVSDSKSVVFAVNLSTGTKYPDIDVIAKGIDVNDGVISISPLGDLIVLNGANTAGGNSDYTMTFDLQGNVQAIFPEYGLPSHFDLSVDNNGNEVAVGVAKTSAPGVPGGSVVMRDLRTAAITALNDGGYSVLASTRNQNLPGWAFVDDAGVLNPNNYPPYNDEIFAVKLDGSLTVARLAHAHSNWIDYETQGFVVPSPDGLRFVFASDWGSSSGRPVQTYVVDIRDLCSCHLNNNQKKKL
jgi:hypothetical protein